MLDAAREHVLDTVLADLSLVLDLADGSLP
jgi:hypothetical protein